MQDRLLEDAIDLDAGVGQIGLLGPDQRFTDRNGAAAAQLLRKAEIQPFGILGEVGVAILVAGPGQQHRALAGKGLRPIGLSGQVWHAVGVDDVVTGVAARAEDDDVAQI